MADTVEGVEAMADMLERARQQPRKAISSVHVYASSLHDMVDSVIVAMRGDVMSGEAATGSGEARATRPVAASTPLPPPISNTGGKVPRKAGKGRGGKS